MKILIKCLTDGARVAGEALRASQVVYRDLDDERSCDCESASPRVTSLRSMASRSPLSQHRLPQRPTRGRESLAAHRQA